MSGSASALAAPEHLRWLAAETDRLLDFAQASAVTGGGFGWLDSTGRVDPSVTLRLWVNARMTHVFALAHLLGRPGAAAMVDHGLAAMLGDFRDDRHGGWFAELGADGPVQPGKQAYDHAFVVIAASSAVVAGHPEADRLLADVLEVVDDRFWSDSEGACRESWSRDWQSLEDYRGANANMHMVEAFLAAADATGDRIWRERALRIAELLIGDVARRHGWRIPEHFDGEWHELLDYNRDQPRHPFRPFGVTPGHGLEWARLVQQLGASLPDPPGWIRDAARGLFTRAVEDGWDTERGGFVYTTDHRGRPLVLDRFHWVLAEAIGAAAVLSRTFGDETYTRWYREYWRFAQDHLVDHELGSWHHELDAENRVSTRTWQGKPDVYHAVQATLVPRLPTSPGLALALGRGCLMSAAGPT